jgi:DNA-binding NarL/FixJ family response regulator/tetratricopeptide (TPR) repeat protein
MLVARPGRSPVMVGRAAELARLARLVGAEATPSVALIAGEAGVGKTRLVRELLDTSEATVPVFAGQADPGALGRPFELLLDAFDGVDADPATLALVTDRTRPLEDRLEAGIDLVRAAVGDRPALVVFEDLHWADSESITLFERLAEPECGPLTLVGTYRPDAVHRRHPVSDLLHLLERRHAVVHVRLLRLSPVEVGAFLGAVYGRAPSYRVIEALHTRTGGNPYFLEELLAAAGDDVDPEQLVDLRLPWSSAELMRRQLDDLDADDRCVLEAAAVLGQRIEFDVLATVAGKGERELIDVLRRLVAQGLLLEVEHDVFSFRHALAREAIQEELLGREKRRLHRAALDALTGCDSCDLAAVAHHAAGAGDHERLVDAARRGSHQYLDEGSTYQALQLAELGLAEADDDPTLLAVASRAAWLSGLVTDASAHNRHRLDVARASGDLEAESATLRLQVRLEWEMGDHQEMARRVGEVVALLDRLADGHEKGMGMALLAQAAMLREDVAAATSWADRALALADSLGDDAVRAHALTEKGSMLVQTERYDEGSSLLEEAADLGERLGDDVVVARALHNLVRTDSRPRDAAVARQQLERMRLAAERVGFDSMAGAAHSQGLADLAEWEGDLDAARAALDDGRRADRGYLLTAKGSWFAVHEAGLALEAGDIAAAADITEQLRQGPGRKAPWYAGLECHVSSVTGDLPGARLALARLVDLGGEPGQGSLSGGMVHDVVSAALRAGIAAHELRPLVALVREEAGTQDPSAAARSLVDAQLEEAAGDPAVALAGFERAADADRWLYPSERGTAHVGAARCAIATGDLDRAKDHVAAAERLLARWHGWRVEELEAVRRRLGGGTEPAGPAVLTPREREVVALIAEGLTNAELAARLFISPKTAAVHVSNVLAKLGMSSRTEVATWAIREGIAS